MAQQSFTEQVHPPWQQQAQTTALEIEQVQRQLEAVQAQDPKSFLSVDPMTVTTGHQQISAQDLMQQTAAFLQQMPTLNGLGIATSGTLSPQLAGTPVFCNGASPSLSTSSFGGQPSPNVHQGGGFFPFSGMDLVSPQPSQQGFMPMSPGFGTDTLQAHDNSPVNRTVYVG